MIGLQECGPAPPRAPAAATPRARERTAQAVEYYNTHLQRARVNAGLSAPRSSYNDRHHAHGSVNGTVVTAAGTATATGSLSKRHHNHHHHHHLLNPDLLYRSNSSLELLEHHARPSNPSSPTLKREYGSHGSIDVIERPGGSGGAVSGTSESFFAMLQDYRPTVLGSFCADQRSPGPSEFLKGRVEATTGSENSGTCPPDDHNHTPQSPKLKGKLSRFLGGGGGGGGGSGGSNHLSNNNLRNQRSNAMDDSAVNVSVASTQFVDAEEIARRRAFAHYDCQSLQTNLGYTVRYRKNLLAKRRNTTTGASAASMLPRSSTPDRDSSDEDLGDSVSNALVLSCPYFRNEIGGEEERVVGLTRIQSNNPNRRLLHRPPLAYGVSVLEYPGGETHWTHSTCPYQKLPRPIESVDSGALYFRKYFKDKEHQNWFGMDEQLGPIAISILRDKVSQAESLPQTLVQYQYRLVIRTSELSTLRGAILEDAIPNIKASSSSKSNMNTKEVLEYVVPEVQLSCLRLGVSGGQTEEQLIKVDEQGLTKSYKVGVLYCKAGQNNEEEMYNNEEAGPALNEFLDLIGSKVRLKGFDKYKAGLDNKSDSTGTYSLYTTYQDCEIMFHVSTMLPFTSNNRQQLLRKRHIGNDIVTIVFQEPGAKPFTPKGIRSQFQHVFIVVQAINPCTENTHYSVAVSRSKNVQIFGPPLRDDAVYPKGKAFVDFLLAKVVNAENAAHRSEKFVTMATRTRHEYLKDLVDNFSTSTQVETRQKISLFKKSKEKIRPRFIPDATQRGAFLWQVNVCDSGQSKTIKCFLGISVDSFVVLEESSRQIVFVTPCKSILGWLLHSNSLKIYYHQGECLMMSMCEYNGDRDELIEIVERLKAVTQGVRVEEFNLQRNIMKQLGFNVQPDGIVTLVESTGPAAEAGVRQNSRIVEICKVAVSTLTYDSMVDLLKTSNFVTLSVIPPLDGLARKGCTLQNCKYNESIYDGDYESLDDSKSRKAPQMQQAVPGGVKRFYEGRSVSPPRSSNSSGYGTGSSSKSFLTDPRFPNEGTMTSSSSGHSNEERWTDLEAESIQLSKHHSTPHKSHSNNTYPSTPKRNNVHLSHLQVSQSHNHFPQNLQHNKIQHSHSLPLQHTNFSQPLSAALHSNTNDYVHKLDKNNLIKQQNERVHRETEYTRSKDYVQINGADGHSTDSSIGDRFYGIGSEEELSNGSASPKSSRKPAKHLNSWNSSRNQSPRSLNGEAKLRPGVTTRSSNRNSANLNNTIQEELIRLISPDNIEAIEVKHKEPKSRSRENLNSTLSVHKTESEVILAAARPATVISNASTASSPLPNEFKSLDRISPRTKTSPNKSKGIVGPDAMPLPQGSDWPSLVAAAESTENGNLSEDDRGRRWDEEDPPDASITSNNSVPELRNHVSKLETRVSRETRRRLSLEEEVRRLKDENRKLQDQAHAAIQQLRRFTEWFFQNVQGQ